MLAANRLRQSLEPDRRSPRATAAGEQKWPRVRQSSRLPRHSQVLEPELCAHAVAECVATSRKETSRCRPAHTRNHSEAESSAVPENPQWPQHRRLPSHSATAVAWRTFPTSVAGRGPILRTHKFLNRPGWLRNLLLATARMPVRRLSVKFRVMSWFAAWPSSCTQFGDSHSRIQTHQTETSNTLTRNTMDSTILTSRSALGKFT